jgi:hypothetical protein
VFNDVGLELLFKQGDPVALSLLPYLQIDQRSRDDIHEFGPVRIRDVHPSCSGFIGQPM